MLSFCYIARLSCTYLHLFYLYSVDIYEGIKTPVIMLETLFFCSPTHSFPKVSSAHIMGYIGSHAVTGSSHRQLTGLLIGTWPQCLATDLIDTATESTRPAFGLELSSYALSLQCTLILDPHLPPYTLMIKCPLFEIPWVASFSYNQIQTEALTTKLLIKKKQT